MNPAIVTRVSFHEMYIMMASDPRMKITDLNIIEMFVLSPSYMTLVSLAILDKMSPVFIVSYHPMSFERSYHTRSYLI